MIFPCGQTHYAEVDSIGLPYGAADSCIVLATRSTRAVSEWMEMN